MFLYCHFHVITLYYLISSYISPWDMYRVPCFILKSLKFILKLPVVCVSYGYLYAFFSITLIKYLLHWGILEYFKVLLLVHIIYLHTWGFTASKKDIYCSFMIFLLTGTSWQDRSGFPQSSFAAKRLKSQPLYPGLFLQKAGQEGEEEQGCQYVPVLPRRSQTCVGQGPKVVLELLSSASAHRFAAQQTKSYLPFPGFVSHLSH